jgi:hypothetical protein
MIRGAAVQNLTDRRFARALGRQVPTAHAQNRIMMAAIATGGFVWMGGANAGNGAIPLIVPSAS